MTVFLQVQQLAGRVAELEAAPGLSLETALQDYCLQHRVVVVKKEQMQASAASQCLGRR